MAQYSHTNDVREFASRATTALKKPASIVALCFVALISGLGFASHVSDESLVPESPFHENLASSTTDDTSTLSSIREPDDTSDSYPNETTSSKQLESTSSELEQESWVKVHVDGAVQAPGIYELKGRDLRVADAIEAAGGLLADADTTTVNLAQELNDKEKIYVPFEGDELEALMSSFSSNTNQSQNASININLADQTQLMELPGIGEATAEAIIHDREQYGPFTSIEDLMRVSGIGQKKFERLKDYICV